MEFAVTRTSSHGVYDLDVPPCEGARRTMGVEEIVWVIEIENIERLIEFVERHGEVILTNHLNDKFTTIEIYDDHRE